MFQLCDQLLWRQQIGQGPGALIQGPPDKGKPAAYEEAGCKNCAHEGLFNTDSGVSPANLILSLSAF